MAQLPNPEPRGSREFPEEVVDQERFCRIATSTRHVERDTAVGVWPPAVVDHDRRVRYVLGSTDSKRIATA